MKSILYVFARATKTTIFIVASPWHGMGAPQLCVYIQSERTMKAAFLYPNSQPARFTAGKLLESGIKVLFYCPELVDLDQAENMIFELNIVGMEQDELRMVKDSFSVPKTKDLTDCELISKYFKHHHHHYNINLSVQIPTKDASRMD